jgi:uncharacterized damage-inducible protein DinB
MDVVKLVRYIHASRREYLETLKKLPWREVVGDRGASFPSMRDIFLHALECEDITINYVIGGRFKKIKELEELVSKGYEKFLDIGDVEKHVEEVEKKVEAYLEKITPSELEREVSISFDSSTIVMRVEDLLIDLCIEDISHMGELIAIFWQMDEKPPFLSWYHFIR